MMKHNARLYTFYTISIVFVFMILFVYVNRKGNSDLIMNLRKNRMLEENENLEKKHERKKDKEQWKTQDIALKDGYKSNTNMSNDLNGNLSSSNNFPQPESFNSDNYGKMSYEEKNHIDRNGNKSDGKNKDSNDSNIDEPQRNINSFLNMMDKLNSDNEKLKKYLQQRYVPPDHVRMPQEFNSEFEMPENILSQQFYRNQLENQIPADLLPEGTRSKNPSDKKDDDEENKEQNKPEYNLFKSPNQKENDDKEHQDEKKNPHQDKNTTDEMMNFAGMFDDLSLKPKKNQRTNKSFKNQLNQNALPISNQFTPIYMTSQNAFTLDESNKDENNNDKKSNDSNVDLQNMQGIYDLENNKKHNKDDKETDQPPNENMKSIPDINNSELSLEKTNKSKGTDNNLLTPLNIDETQMNAISNKADNTNTLENENDKDNEKNHNQDNQKDKQKSIEDLIHENILDDSPKNGKDKKDNNKEENVPEIQISNNKKGKSQDSMDVVNYDNFDQNQQQFESINSSKKEKDKKSDDDLHVRNILPLPNQLNPRDSTSKDKTSGKQEIPVDPIISPENPDNQEKHVSHHKPEMIQETIMFSIKSSHGKDKKQKKNDKTKSDLSESEFKKGKTKNTSSSITIVSKLPLTTEKKHDHKKTNQNGVENDDSLLTDKGIIKPENIPPRKSKKSKHGKKEMTPAEKISANYTESTPIFRDLTEIEPKKSLKEKRNEIQNDSRTKKNIVPVIKFKDLQNEMKNVEDIINAMNFLRYGKEIKFAKNHDESSENNNSLDNDSDEENYHEKEVSQTSSETGDEDDEYENMHKKKSHHHKKYKRKEAHDRSRGIKHKKYRHKKMIVDTEPDAEVKLK